MGWVDLSGTNHLDYAPDISWTPTITALYGGASGWTAGVCKYKRIGNLIIAMGTNGGPLVTYGNGWWLLGGLPATPYVADTSQKIMIGQVYYYNVGRASYGHVMYDTTLGAHFMSANATSNQLSFWTGGIFNGSAGDRSLIYKLFYEAA